MGTIEEYITEIQFAVSKLFEAIWHEHEAALKLRQEIESEERIVEQEYDRAILIQRDPMDSDDVMLGAGMYWDNYFGRDKDLYYKKAANKDVLEKLAAREFSIYSLSGSILEYAKKGLSLVYGQPQNWPCGRIIGSICSSELILQARNQSTHIDEAKAEGKFRNTKVMSCFSTLAQGNRKFAEFLERDMSFDIVQLLGWKTFENFSQDMRLFQPSGTPPEVNISNSEL